MEVAENPATTELDVCARDVTAAGDTIAALVASVRPAEVPLSWTSGIWSAFDRIERLAAGAKTLLADRLAESEAWKRAGFAHPAEYMAQLSGTTVTSARDTLAASRRLDELPATAAQLRDGGLSTAQVHQISDAAHHNPDAEAGLLAMASDGSSMAELRDACGKAKAAADKDPDERNKRLRAQRRLRQRRESDGAWSMWAQGTLTDAAVFNAAVEDIIDGLLQDAHDQGETLTREQAAYDALIEMANRINTTDWTDLDDEADGDDSHELDRDDDGNDDDADLPAELNRDDEADRTNPTDGQAGSIGLSLTDGPYRDATRDGVADPGPDVEQVRTDDAGVTDDLDRDGGLVREGLDDPDSADVEGPAGSLTSPPPDDHDAGGRGRTTPKRINKKKRPRRKAQPYLGIVRAELPALRRGYPVGNEVVEIAGLGPISVPEAREILGGDAVLQLVLTNGVNANVTNLRRQPNTAQRMALLAQMPCCSVKGCARTWVQLDHRKDWASTHVTRLEYLDPLCWWHHQQKTLHGWALVDGTGKRSFVPPTDPRHPNNTRTRPAGDDNDGRTFEPAATDTAVGSPSIPAPRDDAAEDHAGPGPADGDLPRTRPPPRELVAV